MVGGLDTIADGSDGSVGTLTDSVGIVSHNVGTDAGTTGTFTITERRC